MPEGDTVHLVAARLHRGLASRTLTKTDFRVPQHATVDLSGYRVEEVAARGKHLLVRIAPDVTLHTHLKMEGEWHLYRTGERWRAPGWQARVVLETDRWVAVGFSLPVLDLLARHEEQGVVGHLGPDPLRNWDEYEALHRLRAATGRSIADALLDQRVIAGLGNVYKSEICFLRGVHPDTLVEDVGDLRAVVALAKRLLDANRTTGRQITTGDVRRGRTSWVYGRAGRPCRRCGTTISRSEQSSHGTDRVAYWCPSCQRSPRSIVGKSSSLDARSIPDHK